MDYGKLFKAAAGTLIGAALGGGLGVFFMSVGLSNFLGGKIGVAAERVGQRLRHLSYEIPFAFRPYKIPPEVALVYMDDQSHQDLKQPYNAAWDRSLHAVLLERLSREGAKGVVFDIVFNEPGPPEADARLANAIKSMTNVVLAADYSRLPGGEGAMVVVPHEPFLEGAAGIGVAEMLPDYDLYIRRHFPGNANDLVSTLSWEAARVVGAPIAQTTDVNVKNLQRWINYYGPPGTLLNYSFSKVITNTVPLGTFSNKVVFVGARIHTHFSGDRKDEYRSPYSFWMQETKDLDNQFTDAKYMPGVEIQATIFLNLMRGDWLMRVHPVTDFWIVVLSGLFAGIALSLLRPFYASIVTVVLLIGITSLAFWLFIHRNLWFSWFVIVGVLVPVTAVWSIVFNSVSLYVQKRLLTQSLAMYVSRSRVNQILKKGEMLKPGASKQEVSIIFSDIANFTTMSEGMDSDTLARLMNNYFETAVNQGIHKADGTVVKFIGDAIFAIWNAPENQVNHQELACKGALLLRDQITPFAVNKAGLDVRTRIGLHCGVANVGNFGSSTRIDYTALGENINLASRMEGLNKYLGTDVLATGDISRGVQDNYTFRFCGLFQLKGFEKAVEVYELVGFKDKEPETRVWREAFAQSLKSFQAGDLDAAERGYSHVLELKPKDGPSLFYLKHIAELRDHPPQGAWSGKVELKEK